MTIRRTIWLAYDLGVRGDYSNLYAWLDERKAKECGDSLAVLKYEHSGSIKAALRRDLQQAMEIDKRTRIYVIYRNQTQKTMKGIFVFGNRKAPPWTGYAGQSEDIVDDEF